MSKQSILNYEVEMIEYHSEGLSKPDSSPNHQYTTWQLDQKILQLMGSSPCTIRWLGNHEFAYLDAFVYVMLSFALKKESLILKLKSRIYQLSQKYLQKSHQKLIVEFLCLLQYTQDKYSFLRKYPEVVKMIVYILKAYERENTYKDTMKMSSFILESPIKEKRKQSFCVFCEKFNFITVFHPNEFTYRFVSQKDTISVVVEKDCFFVVEKFPVLSDEKDQSDRKTEAKMTNSTPRFCMTTNTFYKRKSEKTQMESNQSNKKKNPQNILQNNNNDSIVCSIEEIYNQLQKDEAHKKSSKKIQQQRKYRTETLMGQRQGKAKSKSRNKDGESIDKFLIRQYEYQQKRREHWLKLQNEYYERKKQISTKIKQEKNRVKIKNQRKPTFSSNSPNSHDQKQRKMSFNSFTGTSVKERFDTDFSELDYEKRSTAKSHQGKYWTKDQIRSRKASMRESPVVENKILKKMPSNQIFINQDKRLSVIQEEDRLKFETFNSGASTMHRSPKPTSFNSSKRETFDANFCVTFNYLNKSSHSIHSPQDYQSSSFHKLRYCVSPIRV